MTPTQYLLVSVVPVLAIVAVYFIWIRKPAAKAEQTQQQQPQS